MSWLPWIRDEALEEAVTHLLKVAADAKKRAVEKFDLNVIDPFSALFEIAGFQLDYNGWISSEQNRKAQKTLQNHIGDFHQKILGSIDGWQNLKTGAVVDLCCTKEKIIAEVKNKFNTISFGNLAELYEGLEAAVMPKMSTYKDYTAYYVAIIPSSKERYNKPFTPSNRKVGNRCASNDLIREIDGASFYALATGDNKALENLYDVLPKVIKKVTNGVINIADGDKIKAFFTTAYG
ncbi:MAG: Eco47II family restriction endonuclease [Chitinophagaceae bacterium]|jgi:hypothetical protein